MESRKIYFSGEIPIMTKDGSFAVNNKGVVVSQLHRSPVFFDHDKGKTHSSGKFMLPE